LSWSQHALRAEFTVRLSTISRPEAPAAIRCTVFASVKPTFRRSMQQRYNPYKYVFARYIAGRRKHAYDCNRSSRDLQEAIETPTADNAGFCILGTLTFDMGSIGLRFASGDGNGSFDGCKNCQKKGDEPGP
jgi:hypothetical protein